MVLSKEMTTDQLIDLSPSTPAMKDDRPINEYFALRGLLAGKNRWQMQ
jgi:hypothetical protein